MSERLSKSSQDPSKQLLLPKPIPMANSFKSSTHTARQHSQFVPSKDHTNKQGFNFKIEERTTQASDPTPTTTVDTIVSIPEPDIYDKDNNKG